MINNQPKKERFTQLLLLAAGLIFFIQPFFAWFTADDFCIMNQVKEMGVFKTMWFDYMHWDGRSICLTYPVSRLGLFFGKSWLGPLIGSVLLVVIAWVIIRISETETFKIKNKVSATVLLTAVLWLVCFNFSSQTIYWTTGMGYNLDLLLLLFAYFLAIKKDQIRFYYIIGIPAFLYAGTVSPNGSLALLFVLFMHFINDFVILKNKEYKKYFYPAAFILCGLLIVVLAPGNANRLVGMDRHNYTHIWTIYFNFKLLFSNLWTYNTPILWVFMLMGLTGASLNYFSKIKEANSSKWQNLLLLVFVHRWFLAACIAFLFYLPFPGLNSPRTNIHFAIFMMVYAITNLPYLKSVLNDYADTLYRKAAIVLLLLFVFLASSQAFDARYAKNQINARNAMLSEMRGKSVVLTHDDVIRPPGTRKFEDLSEDSSYWINSCISNYYGLKSIKMIGGTVNNDKKTK